MKEKVLFVLLPGIILLCSTCQKDEVELSLLGEIEREALNEEQAAFWEDQEDVVLTASDIILPNGFNVDEYLQQMDPDFLEEWNYKSSYAASMLEPSEFKNLLIAKMSKVALYLTKRSNFVYEGSPEFGMPDQNGLAYSYGSRNYKERMKPPKGTCTEEVYGLDCSGFIYHLFLAVNVDLTTNTWADKQRKPAELLPAIKAAYPEMEKILVEDLGKIETSAFKSGDIIYWQELDPETGEKKAYHIGMVLKNKNGNLAIAQSNGRGDSECYKNYGLKRGPRFVTLLNAVKPESQWGFGDDYGIVRIDTEKPEPLDYTKCGVLIRIYGYYHETTAQSSWDRESNNGGIQSEVSSGSFEGNTFTGSYSKTVGTDVTSGSITAILNDDHDVLVSLNWTETTTFGTSPSDSKTISCKLANIPTENSSLFEVEGDSACNYISSLSNEQTITEGLSFSLTSYKCTSGSKVMVYFSK